MENVVKKMHSFFSGRNIGCPAHLLPVGHCPAPSAVEEKRREQFTYLSLVALQGASPTSCQWATAPPSLTVEKRKELCTYLSLVALQGAPPTSCQWATAPPSLTV
jgi:hypothetical protein